MEEDDWKGTALMGINQLTAPGRRSGRRGPTAALGAFITALLVAALTFGVAAPAGAYQRDADSTPEWQFSGNSDMGLGSNINHAQNVHAFCTGDSQGGPYGTRSGTFAYSSSRTIGAGQEYVPGSTSRGGDGWTVNDLRVPGSATAQVAYLIGKYDEASVRAAVSMPVHWAINSYSLGGAARLHPGVPQSVQTLAQDYRAEASRLAGPYSVAPTNTADPNLRGGLVSNVGAKSASGTFVPGYAFTVTLAGPATFVTTGTNTVTGSTASGPLSYRYRATGNGAVTATVTVTGLQPTSFRVLEDNIAQDLFVAGPDVTQEGTSGAANVTVGFTPTISTTVSSVYIDAGEPFASNVTMGHTTADRWVSANGAFVPVEATGQLYGPYDRPQELSTTVPASAKIVATESATFAGPGTKTVTSATTASRPGYYTWVWTARAADSPYLNGDVTTGFFSSRSITAVTTQMSVLSQVSEKWVDQGDRLTSLVSVVPGGGTWPNTTSGVAAPVTVRGTLYGPYRALRPEVTTVPRNATSVGSVTMTISGTGPRVSPSITAPNNGYYTWVWEIDKDTQTGQAKDLVAADAATNYFAPGSYSIGRMRLKVTTQVTADVADVGEPLWDQVSVGLAEPDDLWLLNEQGQSVHVTARGSLYGPYPEVGPRQAGAPAGEVPYSTATLAFNEAGTSETGAPRLPSEDGVYTWVWSVDKNAQLDQRRFGDYLSASVSDGFFTPGEITHVRGQVAMTASARDDSGDHIGQVGEDVQVRYTIINTSNTPVKDLLIQDSRIGQLDRGDAGPGFTNRLEPGQSVTFTGSYRVTEQDVRERQDIVFDATVNGQTVSNIPLIESTASARIASSRAGTTPAPGGPGEPTEPGVANGLELTQRVRIEPRAGASEDRAEGIAYEGDNLEYTFTVHNVSRDVLYDVSVATPVEVEVVGSADRLDPGERVTFVSSTNVVDVADVQAGSVTNEAVAVAHDSLGAAAASNTTTVVTPTAAQEIIIEAGGGAGEVATPLRPAIAGTGLVAIVVALVILAPRRRQQAPVEVERETPSAWS